jgi:hypothetical protein
LLPFIGYEQQHQSKGIAVTLKGYLELADETGSVIHGPYWLVQQEY